MTFLEETLRRTAQELYGSEGAVVPFAKLLELGWEELVADEPVAAVSTLAEAQGRLRGTSRIVELEMARHLGLDPATEALAFALGGTTATASVDVVLVADAVIAPTVVIPVSAGGVVLCRIPAADLRAIPVDGIDPTAGWTRFLGGVDPASGTRIDDPTWTIAVAAGRLALAHELIGGAQAMLDLAVVHVTDRHQFGVPLGTFQAVQHRLANVHVDAEAARAITRTAWIDRDPWVCAAALAAARRAVETATEHCHQVMGAIGCTWEHGLHRLIRRGIVLSLLLDPGADLRAAVATAVVSLPRSEVLT